MELYLHAPYATMAYWLRTGKTLHVTLIVFHAYRFINNKTLPLWHAVRKPISLGEEGEGVPVIQSEVSAGAPPPPRDHSVTAA